MVSYCITCHQAWSLTSILADGPAWSISRSSGQPSLSQILWRFTDPVEKDSQSTDPTILTWVTVSVHLTAGPWGRGCRILQEFLGSFPTKASRSSQSSSWFNLRPVQLHLKVWQEKEVIVKNAVGTDGKKEGGLDVSLLLGTTGLWLRTDRQPTLSSSVPATRPRLFCCRIKLYSSVSLLPVPALILYKGP